MVVEGCEKIMGGSFWVVVEQDGEFEKKGLLKKWIGFVI